MQKSITTTVLVKWIQILRANVGRYGEHSCKKRVREKLRCYVQQLSGPSVLEVVLYPRTSKVVGWTNYYLRKFLFNFPEIFRIDVTAYKNICGIFSLQKNEELSRWHIYASIRTRRIRLNIAYMRQSATKVLAKSHYGMTTSLVLIPLYLYETQKFSDIFMGLFAASELNCFRISGIFPSCLGFTFNCRYIWQKFEFQKLCKFLR